MTLESYSLQTFLGSHITSTSPPRPTSYCVYSAKASHLIFPSTVKSNCIRTYISLIRSHFMYCSVIWRPFLIKHYICLNEYNSVQPNSYILNYYVSDYKSRLTKLQILPLMHILELNDMIFFICNFKYPHEGFNINSYISCL